MKVLLIGDNCQFCAALARKLTELNYVVDFMVNGLQSLGIMETKAFNLLILTAKRPFGDGLALCRQLREKQDFRPILLLTTRLSETIDGFDAGADDCVLKQADMEEILARIRALLRRNTRAVKVFAPKIEWRGLCLWTERKTVTFCNTPLALTAREYQLLELFLKNQQKVFSCDDLIDCLWTIDDFPSENTVRSHIKKLRQKLKAVGMPAEVIETVYGMGYRLNSGFQPATGDFSKILSESVIYAANGV
ncbi:MAG: response regulator transcription factor [Chloroflexaceae bacterium]|nr:response regulator transcription factor [Chloroflexaceae bacterium]